MTDEEIKMLNRANLTLVDKIPKDVYIITYCNKNRATKDYLNQFWRIMKYIPLPGGIRPTIRFIEGHTLICTKCDHIYCIDYIENSICFKCAKNED